MVRVHPQVGFIHGLHVVCLMAQVPIMHGCEGDGMLCMYVRHQQRRQLITSNTQERGMHVWLQGGNWRSWLNPIDAAPAGGALIEYIPEAERQLRNSMCPG